MSQSGYNYCVTVVSADAMPLEGERLDKAIAALAPKQWKWLRRRKALDCLFTGAPAGVQLTAVHDLGGIDLFLQPLVGEGERIPKKLMVCDMDSTVIGQECIDELADFIGLKDQMAAITEAAMKGELNFEEALNERVALLKGLPESALQQCYEERIRLNPGARELVQGLRAAGTHTVLVTGGFLFFSGKVGVDAGFHEHYANRLEIENGALTGRVLPPILNKDAKKMILEKKMQELGLKPENVLAIGDGANDLPMLQAAGMGVAFRAKQMVRAATKYQLEHNDLSALLWVCGLKF